MAPSSLTPGKPDSDTPDASSPRPRSGTMGQLPAGTTRQPVDASRSTAAPHWQLTLFWRSFFMIGLMLTVSTTGWLMTIRWLDFGPRATQTAQQIASLVNLSRAALIYSDSITRYALMKTLAEEEGVRILPREPDDKIERISQDQLNERVIQQLRARLGPETIVADSVNGEEGLWIGFTIDTDLSYAEAAVEIGDNIHRLHPDLISEDDAVLLGEDVFEGLRAHDPMRYVVRRVDVENFRVS